jgi:glycine/D-amino acid oxidase-like deaminating enzyme
MPHTIRRRDLLAGAGALLAGGALPGCSLGLHTAPGRPDAAPALRFDRVRASTDRITRITVCTRPFRAAGPRIETERVGPKQVVHNYGHGGSGWSLSWGSSALAVQMALATGQREFGVLGCGALGLTSALLLQQAGSRVTIYAKELPPNVRSSLATGLWTPDSRICFDRYATPEFKQMWQTMARKSYQTYQGYLGLAGDPVEFIDSYFVSDDANARRRTPVADERPKFAELQRELIEDLVPNGPDYPPGTHPFKNRFLKRNTMMMFNLSSYARLLVTDFLARGGRIEVVEFRSPRELEVLPEKTLINATGYGARALFGDESITPVRGQLTRLIPQPEIRYGLLYQNVYFVPRRDGLVFQVVGESDYYGFDDASTVPDRAEADLAVHTIGKLFDEA